MSLVIATYVPECIVLASDSRQFLTVEGKTPAGRDFKAEIPASDFVAKTFLLETQRIGISNYGQDLLAGVLNAIVPRTSERKF